MAFSGLAFIFHFLPIFLIAYYITKPRYRNGVLLVGSLIFYAMGNPAYLILLLISVLINFLMVNRIYNLNNCADKEEPKKTKQKVWLILVLVYDFVMLFAFKYVDFAIDIFNKVSGSEYPSLGIALPLGISFYTFQMISFAIDVYRAKYTKRITMFHFVTYATMFPQIISGPITRYSDVQRELESYRYVKPKDIEKGISFFAVGLSYKVLLADKIASLWTDIWRVGVEGIDVSTAWLGAWAYSFEIYFDFAGYSLMAIGVAAMLGFRLPQNFRDPYASKSMTEFWRNWHMTLGKWFRDYLYIPLGGNRKGRFRMIVNTAIVWLFTGLWHGASYNFIIWGAFLALVICIEKTGFGKWLEKTKVLGHIYMIILIPISWTIFNITDIGQLFAYLGKMFFIGSGSVVGNGMQKLLELLMTYKWMLVACIFFATPYPYKWIRKYHKSWIVKIILFAAFWYSVYQLARSGSNPFIYFGF